jgi:ribosomal protein S18 acetylase RimI-like enzyme
MIESLRLELLAPVDWRVLRAARLEALVDSPHAFMSSYAWESGWDELKWRRLFDASSWIIAREANAVIGLARTIAEPECPSTRHVESVWVAPTYRRRGVCHKLVEALAKIDRQMGVTDLLLWVLEDNHVAKRVYETLGFESTGERQFLSAFGQFERRLRLNIGQLPDASATWSDHFLVDDHRAEFGPSPGLKLQELHRHTDAGHPVHPTRELSADRRGHPSSR